MPVRERLASVLDPAAEAFLAVSERRIVDGDARVLEETLPALARRTGRARVGGGLLKRPMVSQPAAVANLDQWRACDAAGLILLEAAQAGEARLLDLYLHGDLEERVILLRSLALLPLTGATITLLDEVQRTNVQTHFDAAVCDSNLLSRARAHPEFDAERLNKLVLKAAFVGIPLARMFDLESQANPDLSRMLQDLATEREAAGRAVWTGTNVMIGSAPVRGTVARLLGGLEHGDDLQRAGAVRGLIALGRADLKPFAAERLPREPRADIRELLERLLD